MNQLMPPASANGQMDRTEWIELTQQRLRVFMKRR